MAGGQDHRRPSRTRQDRPAPTPADHAGEMTALDLRDYLADASSTRLFVTLWGGMATVDVARAGAAPAVLQAGLLAGLAAACALGQPVRSALAVAAVAWLVTQGFVVHDAGSLSPFGPLDLV